MTLQLRFSVKQEINVTFIFDPFNGMRLSSVVSPNENLRKERSDLSTEAPVQMSSWLISLAGLNTM